MRFLITGGEGFIGSNLKRELEKGQNEVVTIDINGNPDFKASILTYEDVLSATREVDGVFHLAAITSPPQFETDMFLGFNTNVVGTLNVLKASAMNSVPKVVLASSSAVYGDISLPGKENMTIPFHQNLYSTTKFFNEYLGGHFSVRDELDVVSLRYFNAYGAGENSKGMYSSVIAKFFDYVKKAEKPVIFGDGTQRRDFVYIKDIARATYHAMQYGKNGNAYNIGTGKSVTFNEILKTLEKVLERNIEPTYRPNPFRNYQFFTQADVSKTENDLRWKSNYDLEHGMSDMASELGFI